MPDTRRLIKDFISDMITDIRFTDRKIAAGMHETAERAYRELCVDQLRTALKMRHSPRFNRFGYPVL